jgi:hypothetical protein
VIFERDCSAEALQKQDSTAWERSLANRNAMLAATSQEWSKVAMQVGFTLASNQLRVAKLAVVGLFRLPSSLSVTSEIASQQHRQKNNQPSSCSH